MKITYLSASLILAVIPAVAAPPAADSPGFVGTTKLRAPIAIETHAAGEPAIGQPLTITLRLTAGIPADAAVLLLAADAGLAVITPLGDVELGTIRPGEPQSVEVVVVPLAGGASYLRVNVTAEVRGRRQSTGSSVPIRLPEDAPRESAGDEAGKSESTVRSLRAVEEIR